MMEEWVGRKGERVNGTGSNPLLRLDHFFL